MCIRTVSFSFARYHLTPSLAARTNWLAAPELTFSWDRELGENSVRDAAAAAPLASAAPPPFPQDTRLSPFLEPPPASSAALASSFSLPRAPGELPGAAAVRPFYPRGTLLRKADTVPVIPVRL